MVVESPGRGPQVPRPGPPRAESGGCLGHAGGDLRRSWTSWGDVLGIFWWEDVGFSIKNMMDMIPEDPCMEYLPTLTPKVI